MSPPETTVDCPAASEILEGPARDMLVDFERRMLRKDEELWEVRDSEGTLIPYMDKRLGADRSAYAKFITDLHARGIVEYSRYAHERSTVFLFARRTASLGWCLIVVSATGASAMRHRSLLRRVRVLRTSRSLTTCRCISVLSTLTIVFTDTAWTGSSVGTLRCRPSGPGRSEWRRLKAAELSLALGFTRA